MSKEAISEVVQLYAPALDSHSWDLFDAIFTPDAEIDYLGMLRWTDLASFKRDFAEMHEKMAGHQHILGVSQIIVEGDRAFSLTYGRFHVFSKAIARDDGDFSKGGAWYDDELIRTSVGWRIKKRFACNFWWRHYTPEDGSAIRVRNSFPEWVKSGRSPYMNALRGELKRKESAPG